VSKIGEAGEGGARIPKRYKKEGKIKSKKDHASVEGRETSAASKTGEKRPKCSMHVMSKQESRDAAGTKNTKKKKKKLG